MDQSDIIKYLNVVINRKYYIIIPFLLVLLAGSYYILTTPKIYEAETLILLQAQKVPQNYVQSIISSDVDDRLRTITQQVTSRTNLEKIIKENGLYADPPGNRFLIDKKVELLRKNIKIVVSGRGRGRENTNTFKISSRGTIPEKVMRVTNALAYNFISENLKIRESQALGTSTFLADELETIEKRLSEKEEKLKEYRLRYMGALPDQLQTNLNILGQLHMQIDQLNSSLNSAESRKLIIQQQITDSGPSQTSGEEDTEGLFSLTKKLDYLRSKYTDNHPDVIRTKHMIAKLEAAELTPTTPESVVHRSDSSLSTQLHLVALEIENIKKKITGVQSRMKMYQRRVEDTPKREQELLTLNRDYENLNEMYNSMLNRKLESEIAVSMEKKQKGEQFRVIDPAKIPTRSVEPNIRRIFQYTILFGLCLGFGLAFLLDFMDTSFRTPEELEEELKMPVLVSMPFSYTEMELKTIRRKQVLAAVSVGIGFIAATVGVVLAAKGVEATTNYIKKIISIV